MIYDLGALSSCPIHRSLRGIADAAQYDLHHVIRCTTFTAFCHQSLGKRADCAWRKAKIGDGFACSYYYGLRYPRPSMIESDDLVLAMDFK